MPLLSKKNASMPVPSTTGAVKTTRTARPDSKEIDVSETDSTSPKLPHERDESSGTAGAKPSEKIQQAHRDLSRGLQDTDRGPPADRAYKKLKQ